MIVDIVTVLPPLLATGIGAFALLGALDAHHHTTTAAHAAPTTPGDTR